MVEPDTSYTLIGIILSVLMLPFGKLLLWNSFSFATFSWFKFAIMHCAA